MKCLKNTYEFKHIILIVMEFNTGNIFTSWYTDINIYGVRWLK